MFGEHAIKSWSVTQAVIALSSGEAEYYGIVKGSSAGLGVRSVLGDLGLDTKSQVKLVIFTDSSAAKGISSRRGLGKVRHIEVNQFWIQDKVHSGEIEVKKIMGITNIADALTKYTENDMLIKHMQGTCQSLSSTRHNIMPEIASQSLCTVLLDDKSQVQCQTQAHARRHDAYARDGCRPTSNPQAYAHGRSAVARAEGGCLGTVALGSRPSAPAKGPLGRAPRVPRRSVLSHPGSTTDTRVSSQV